MPLVGPQAETNPVLRTLQRRLSSLHEGPSSPLSWKHAPWIFMTKHVSLQQPGVVSFQFGRHGNEKDAWACGVLVPKELSVKVMGKPFCGGAAGTHVPQRPSPPLLAPPNPRFGVAICFYKMWSFSKDIQFPLLLFSCHSQLKSINAPE